MLPLKQVNTRIPHDVFRRFEERAAEEGETPYARAARLIIDDANGRQPDCRAPHVPAELEPRG